MYDRHSPAVRERCDTVHRHSLFVAQLASEINRTAGVGFSGTEFTAGLLHDIGRIILFVKCPLDVTQGAPISASEEDILGLERARFGVDHCTIGYQFAQKNNLPEQLMRAIQNHHQSEEDQLHPELVALVAMANRIANFVQFQHNITSYNLKTCPVFPILARRWNSQREDTFARSLPSIVVRAIRNTRIMLKSFA